MRLRREEACKINYEVQGPCPNGEEHEIEKGPVLGPRIHGQPSTGTHISASLDSSSVFLRVLHNAKQSTYQTHRTSNCSFLTSSNN